MELEKGYFGTAVICVHKRQIAHFNLSAYLSMLSLHLSI